MQCFLKINDERILFGSNAGLFVLDVVNFKIVSKANITDLRDIWDATITGEKGVFAISCKDGLIILKLINKRSTHTVHLKDENLISVCYLK